VLRFARQQRFDSLNGFRLRQYIDAVEYATLEWVDCFNHRRLLEPIGNIPPAELEQAYYRHLEESAMVA
jgi:putative transposase